MADEGEPDPSGVPQTSPMEDEDVIVVEATEDGLVQCSFPNCFKRVSKTRVVQPIVYESLYFSCKWAQPDISEFRKFLDKPICAKCERKCRRRWIMFNSISFGKLGGLVPLAMNGSLNSVKTYDNEMVKLRRNRDFLAPEIALLFKGANVFMENVFKSNREFASVYAKHLEIKRQPVKTITYQKSIFDREFIDLCSDEESNTNGNEDEIMFVSEKQLPLNPERPKVLVGDVILYATGTLKDPWARGVVCKVIVDPNKDIYIVKDAETKTVKHLFLNLLAYVAHPKEPILKHANRILVKFSGGKFYSGIILYLEKDKGDQSITYHVHLDNGQTLNCSHKDIRVICAQTTGEVWRDVTKNEQVYVRHCLRIHPDRLLVKAKEGQSLSVYLGSDCVSAVVLKVESNFVQLKFTNGRLETLHLGSPRFKAIRDIISVGPEKKISFEKHGRVSNVDMKSRAKELNLRPHVCSPSCYTPVVGGDPSRFHYTFEKCKNYPTYAIPIALGWKRQILSARSSNKISYQAPCGRRLPSMKSVLKYLQITKSDLEISFFTFDTNVRSLVMFEALNVKWKCNDYSKGKEKIPISCVNSIDTSRVDFIDYTTEKTVRHNLHFEKDENFLTCCDCTDNCQDKLKCKCQLLTISEEQHLRGRKDQKVSIGYQYRILTETVTSGIYECNPRCSCRPQLCLNRVAQLPIRNHLQIFKTEKCGWGIRTLIDLPLGAFVCIYVGNLYQHSEAMVLGKEGWGRYLADLDLIEVAESSKEGYEDQPPELEFSGSDNESEDSDVGASVDIDLPTNGAAEKNDESAGRSRSRKSRKRMAQDNNWDDNDDDPPPNSSRKYFGPAEFAFVMDAMDSGNLGRFLNHACGPNLIVQNCFVDSHDIRYPWVSFFTSKYVAAGGELRWNYGYEDESDDETYDPSKSDNPGAMCHCGTAACKKGIYFKKSDNS